MKFLSLLLLSGVLATSCAHKKSCCSKDSCDKDQKQMSCCKKEECKGDSCEKHKAGECKDKCEGSCEKKKQ